MPEVTPAQIEQAISHRFGMWTNFLREEQASPTICIATGHVGAKRSSAQLVLCLPADLNLDWMIDALQDTLDTLQEQRARTRPNIVTGL